ncbi:PIR Superfamily Protein [Plasmodium ovale wallikeri]|uniref:Plasmodium vivax Vir protein, putative n=2 Tax=Plasmodium ovale TaxID=36330 RepID=A0A1C3KKZ7_PLAOA|nr:PIR Superfamily Protein [Plasmodium ovale wallikeri]SBT74658.1 Plasmodium vivax Vir protein, putative [Plasmodium ovale]
MADNINALKQIDSLYFDYILENINGMCTNCATCSKYGKDLTNLFSFQLLCQRLVKNIEYIHSAYAINSEYLDEKSCDDFIYWIHNNVYNMNDKNNHNENTRIFNDLKKIWIEVNNNSKGSGIDPLHKCDISKIETLNFDELKEKKMMSDYCHNFNTLRTKLTTHSDKPFCEIYYDYFKKTMKAYDKVSKLCNNPPNSKCPNICLGKNNDPKLILDNIKCAKIQAQEKKENLIPEEKCNTEKDALSSQLQQALSAADNPAFNYSDPRSVFLILFTFWGMLLTFFFLYKLTPFSSWMRNKLQKRKIVSDNFDEQVDNESIYDYSESVNRNIQNIDYNISYNSDWNSSG